MAWLASLWRGKTILVQPFFLRARFQSLALLPSDPGTQRPALLPQTQVPKANPSLRPKSPEPSPLPPDPRVQRPTLLSQAREARPQSSSLKAKGQIPSLPLIQESRSYPSSLRPRVQ